MSIRLIYLTDKRDPSKFFEILQRHSQISLRDNEIVKHNNTDCDYKTFESIQLANKFMNETVSEKLSCGFIVDDGCSSLSVKSDMKDKRKFDTISSQDCSETCDSSVKLVYTVAKNVQVDCANILAQIDSTQRELDSLAVSRDNLHRLMHHSSVDKSQCSSFICLNIGGKIMNLKRSLVDLHATENVFFALICGKYDRMLPNDKNGRIFLDLDAKWVDPLINLARDMAMWDGSDANVRPMLGCDPLYSYGLNVVQGPNQSKLTNLCAPSQILQAINVDMNAQFSTWLDVKQSFVPKLLFRGSRDGFTAKKFHELCDNHEHTVCIIRDTDGNVFGGYTDVAWRSSLVHYWTTSLKSFLFSFRTRDCSIISPKVFRSKYSRWATYYDASSMCAFGECHDLYISDNCNTETNSYSTDHDTYGLDACFSKNTYFCVNEIEVFSLNFSDKPACVGSIPPIVTIPLITCAPNCDYFSNTVSSFNHMLTELHERQELVKQTELYLLTEARRYRDELRYVAGFTGVQLESSSDKDVSNEKAYTDILHEIECLVKQMTVDRVEHCSTVLNGTSSIVYINAGGTVLAVSKATLLQAPSGSILANMASDVWGHDLDSEGNILQDVNPELFRLIIANLRLKTLLQREDRMSEVPPISVYEDQKAAISNLLAFYAMSEVALKVCKRGVV